MDIVKETLDNFRYGLNRVGWKSDDEKKLFVNGAIQFLGALKTYSNFPAYEEMYDALRAILNGISDEKRATFERNAAMVGLPADCYMKSFRVRRKVYTITDITPSKPKFCVGLVDEKGKGFRAPVSFVLSVITIPEVNED